MAWYSGPCSHKRQSTTSKVKKQIPLELNNWTAVNRISLANCSHPDLGLSHQCCKLSCPLPGIANWKKLSTQVFLNRALMQISSNQTVQVPPIPIEPVDGRAPRARAKQMTSAIRWEARASVVSPYLGSQLSYTALNHCSLRSLPDLLKGSVECSSCGLESTGNLKHLTCSCRLHTDTHLNISASASNDAPIFAPGCSEITRMISWSGWLTWKICLVWTCLDLPKAATVTTKDPTLYVCSLSLTPMTPPAGQTSGIPTQWCPESGQSAGREGHRPCQWPSTWSENTKHASEFPRWGCALII